VSVVLEPTAIDDAPDITPADNVVTVIALVVEAVPQVFVMK
jgi:hypothetical protein